MTDRVSSLLKSNPHLDEAKLREAIEQFRKLKEAGLVHEYSLEHPFSNSQKPVQSNEKDYK